MWYKCQLLDIYKIYGVIFVYRNNRSYEEETYNRGYNPCREKDENEIDIDKTKIEVENAINTSINNKGILIQIGALIIFDDVFGTSGLTANIEGTPFELKLDEAGSITINGIKLDAEALKENKALVVKKG